MAMNLDSAALIDTVPALAGPVFGTLADRGLKVERRLGRGRCAEFAFDEQILPLK